MDESNDLPVTPAESSAPSGTPPQRPTVVVLVPAHNEEEVIAECIRSLHAQNVKANRVIVVADNCTDRTIEISEAEGAETFPTVGNTHKKAGALNQALDATLPGLGPDDLVLVMDADTIVSPDFIEVGLQTLVEEPYAGGVSSVFLGREAETILGEIQRMEYYRYGRDIKRIGNQAFVMSGTASLFRVQALRDVRNARDGVTLPAADGYYDIYSLTEDNELTFALKTLNYSTPAPGVTSVTDVMETAKNLYYQRHRWYLGALRNLQNYGKMLPKHLRWTYWRQQIGLGFAVAALLLIMTSLVLDIVVNIVFDTTWVFRPLWLIPTVVLCFERTLSAWGMGWKQRIIAFLVFPELIYSMYLTVIFVAAFKDFVRGKEGEWHAT